MQSRPTVARPNDDVCADGAEEADVATATSRKQRKSRPLRGRYNEQVGGGFFIFRRGTTTGRIKTAGIRAGKIPLEHPSLESATTEARRLARLYGGKYAVFSVVDTIDGGPLKNVEARHA